MRTVEFEGIEFEYDESCTLSYKWQKAAVSGVPSKTFACFERLFSGRDEEYADLLDDDVNKMHKLIAACMEDINGAKN